MDRNTLQQTIAAGWEARSGVTSETGGPLLEAVTTTLNALDAGTLRVAEKNDGAWTVNQWVKQAILLSFRLNENMVIEDSPASYLRWFDKVPSKCEEWNDARFRSARFRSVPGAFIRHGAYIGPNVVVMPSFVNIGAHVGEGTMIDSWATIGSCAQIGKNAHISSGAGIGGVLEPLQANPVIIEDHCFVGMNAAVAEGVIVEEGAVLGLGVQIGASTKIIDRESGEIFLGRVPSYAVVVPGSLPGKKLPDGQPGPALACAVIVKRVDATTRAKTSVNDLLRS